MSAEPLAVVVRRRLLGVLFIVIVAGLVSLSLAIYGKAFTDTVDVTLRTDHIGNQLLEDSDVKIRGLIVGSVADVTSDGSGASVTLSLMPDMVGRIPSNVSAQILPKTLFGEQYVSLVLPRVSAGAIGAGDVIRQDQTRGALEAQTVLDHLFPVLTAVRPADLNATLTVLAQALKGRGERLGETLTNLDRYLGTINPHTETLLDDLDKLGKVALEYDDVTPNVVDALSNLQTTVRTVVTQQRAVDDLFVTGTSTSTIVSGFLSQNRERLIRTVGQTSKIAPLLAEYSPEFPCLFQGVAKVADGLVDAFHGNTFHLSIIVDTSSQGGYKIGQQPRIVTGLGPNCFGNPDNVKVDRNGYFQIPDDPKYRCLNDGAPLTADPCGRRPSSTAMRSLNSSAENALVNVLIAHDYGTTPQRVPAAATMLAAPLLRGGEVNVR